MLKSGLAAGVSLLAPKALHALTDGETLGVSSNTLRNGEVTLASSRRERLKLDRGWRFHLGAHADPAMGFEPGGGGSYAHHIKSSSVCASLTDRCVIKLLQTQWW